MPAAMTFASLKTDIASYLERGFTLASDPSVYEQIPAFIGLAQRRLARELKTLGTIQVVTATMTPGLATYAKPDRWRTTVSMRIGINVGEEATGYNTTREIDPRAYEYLRTYWPDQTQRDTPRFVADYNLNNWFVAPTPDAPYPYEVLYNELPALLSDDNQTNYFTEMTPDAILYASLMEAQPFLKNPDMMQTWQGLYDRSMAALNGEDMARFLSRQIRREQN